jgi:hypothetical protein
LGSIEALALALGEGSPLADAVDEFTGTGFVLAHALRARGSALATSAMPAMRIRRRDNCADML